MASRFASAGSMYQGDTVDGPAVAEYVKVLQTALRHRPCKQRLESAAQAHQGRDTTSTERTSCKHVPHAERRRAPRRRRLDADDDDRPHERRHRGRADHRDLGRDPAAALEHRRVRSAREDPPARALLPSSSSRRGASSRSPPNEALVASARKTLQAVPVAKRYYDLFVNSLIDEKYDEGGEDTRANRKFPPITLGDLFADRPDVLKVLTSQQLPEGRSAGRRSRARTPRRATTSVVRERQGGRRPARARAVGRAADARGEGRPRPDQPAAPRRGLRRSGTSRSGPTGCATSPSSPPAHGEGGHRALRHARAEPEWPYLRILRAVEDHTQWKDRHKAALENEELHRELKRRINTEARDARRRACASTSTSTAIGERTSNVPGAFKITTEFGIPPPSATGDSPLDKYLSKLDALRGQLTEGGGRAGPQPRSAPRLRPPRRRDEAGAGPAPAARRQGAARAHRPCS